MVCSACLDNSGGAHTNASATAATEHPQPGQSLAPSCSFTLHGGHYIKGYPYDQCTIT